MGSNFTLSDFDGVLEDVLDRSDIEVKENTTAADVEGWDSIAHLRILITIERSQHISFPVDEVEKVKNVGDLLALINTLKSSDGR